ncbi:alpha/beta fold hydrolase [Micromonospora sp. NPDC051543]|uniref:alpha/beta fold hydrolase n=1 Tax=Micromonospora sp. NPDC051543 TaxID=3364287 RepID=UPI00379D99EE
MTEYLNVDGGTLAYEVTGASGPLVVLAHGMGDSREAYRFVVPRLAAAGYRVAAVDLRGCGESSVGWRSYSRTDIAGDLLAVIRHLGGPAVLVGHSISGGAATIAAARGPELVAGVVELAPFTRKQSIKLGDLRVSRYRKGIARLLGTGLFGSVRLWRSYLDVAYPGRKPADWAARTARIDAMMREPGRMAAMRGMGRSAPTDAGAQLGNVRCPVLIVEGTLDPDWADPRAEGEAIVAALPTGLGRLEMVEGAGHYPHAQYPDEVVTLLLDFLRAHANA